MIFSEINHYYQELRSTFEAKDRQKGRRTLPSVVVTAVTCSAVLSVLRRLRKIHKHNLVTETHWSRKKVATSTTIPLFVHPLQRLDRKELDGQSGLSSSGLISLLFLNEKVIESVFLQKKIIKQKSISNGNLII